MLQLKLPANERLQFLAGQYIDILLQGRQAPQPIPWPTPPHDDALLELHVRHHARRASSPSTCSTTMKEKDILRFEGPLGTFFLREDSDKPIIFVASGTGFAPIKAIIEHAFHSGIARPMVLYWGGRRPRGSSTWPSCAGSGQARARAFQLRPGGLGRAARGCSGRAAPASCIAP